MAEEEPRFIEFEEEPRFTEFEEGWEVIQESLTKFWKIIDAGEQPRVSFTADDYMQIYTAVYDMSTGQGPHDFTQKLYDRYRDLFLEYTSYLVYFFSVVISSSSEQKQRQDPQYQQRDHDEFILREFVKSWNNHKTLNRFMSHLFQYLDRFHTAQRGVLTLEEVGFPGFKNLVYPEVKGRVREAMTSLINLDRASADGGEPPTDRVLLKSVVNVLAEMGLDKYEIDFDVPMLFDDVATSCHNGDHDSPTDDVDDIVQTFKNALKLDDDGWLLGLQ